MRRFLNIILTIVIIAGVGMVGYGGYLYMHDKMATAKAQEKADEVLANREIPHGKSKGSMLDTWRAKEKFEKKGVKKGEVIGKLVIPRIKGNLPIVEGVNPDDLAKGVGHAEFFPLDNKQIVLSGHRDTVFKGVGDLKLGDKFIVKLPYGDFEYELTHTKVVSANDRTVIVPHDEETLTVTTCYPFGYVGNAPNRYIMTAKPIFDMQEYKAQKAAYNAYKTAKK